MCFLISLLAIGPPIADPTIRPKVAEAMAIAFAPLYAGPRASIVGATAADVPCPPVIGVDPVISASNGGSPTNFESPTATAFCKIHNPAATNRKISTFFPPFFNTFKLALNPTLVKNITIKNFCNVSVNFTSAIFVCLKIKTSIENRKPPITGAGIQYFSKNLIFFLSFIPINNKITARPIV